MANLELLQVLPLAVFESGNVPENYKVPPQNQKNRRPPRSSRISLPNIEFSVDRRCALGDEFTVLPILGRISEEGIRIDHTDEATAAALGSIHGWIGHVRVASSKLEVARIVWLTEIVPYCVDASEKHNDTLENLIDHINQGRGAYSGIKPDSHKQPLKSGVVYRKNGRLWPHCDNPSTDGLDVVYDFNVEARTQKSFPRVVFSR